MTVIDLPKPAIPHLLSIQHKMDFHLSHAYTPTWTHCAVKQKSTFL